VRGRVGSSVGGGLPVGRARFAELVAAIAAGNVPVVIVADVCRYGWWEDPPAR
jgi:hypothetical protein